MAEMRAFGEENKHDKRRQFVHTNWRKIRRHDNGSTVEKTNKESKSDRQHLDHMALAMRALPPTRKQSRAEPSESTLQLHGKVPGTLKKRQLDKLTGLTKFGFHRFMRLLPFTR